MPTPVHAQIERIQDGSVFLVTSDGQSLHVPESSLHGSPVAGGEVRLFIVAPPLDGITDNTLAQSLLNELLGTNS